MKVLVTGATGFVGSRLFTALTDFGHEVIVAGRYPYPQGDHYFYVGDIGPETNWMPALYGVEVVVHLASRVHILRDSSLDPLGAYRIVNTEGTRQLAEQSAAAGVRRFVFLSTIKVNGEETRVGGFGDEDLPQPRGGYAQSKYEAENTLWRVSERTGMDVVVIRPPLVYGAGVKGNFLRLLRWIDRGVPLPFANTDNKRSLVSLTNLVDFIICCCEKKSAAGHIFLISDEEDLSTSELVTRLAVELNRVPRLFSIPTRLIRVMSKIAGKEEVWCRLFGSLQIQSRNAWEILGWRPPSTVQAGLREVAHWYMEQNEAGSR